MSLDFTASGRPRVTLKYAQTLDGRIATREGHSQWISSEESRALAHRLRAEHDAVLVGVGTVLADNPGLTVRHVPGDNPRRVVADSRLRIPLSATLLTSTPQTTIIATTETASADREAAILARGADVIRLPDAEGHVDLALLLAELQNRGIDSLLVEGGAAIATSMLSLGLVDEVVAFIAPKIVGSGIEAVGDLGIRHMDQALTFERHSVELLGPDIVFRGTPARSRR